MNNVRTYNFTSNYLRSGSFNIYKLGRICLVNIPSAIDSLPVKQNVIIAELPEELFPTETAQMAFNVPGTTKTVMLTINNKDNTVVLYSYGDTVETLSTRMVLMYFSAK